MLTARKLILSVLAGSLALLVAPTLAQAATITVTDGGDGAGGCTLRNAIDSADTDSAVGTCTAGSDDDTVVVPGTIASPIALNAELVAGGTGALTINGPGAENLTVNGTATNRVLHVVGAVGVTGLTLAGGQALDGVGGGAFVQSGSLGLDGVVVTGNGAGAATPTGSASAFGGGIYADGPLALVDSTVSSNSAAAVTTSSAPADQAGATGGGIFATGSSPVTITRSTISGNTAVSNAPAGSGGSLAGGGGLFVGDGGTNTAFITSSTISGNSAQTLGTPAALATGGGVFTLAGGGTTLVSDTLTENSAANGANLAGTNTGVGNTLLTAPGIDGNCDAPKLSAGFNLEDQNTCGFNQPTDKLVNPASTGLDPDLSSNGGPTQTHALLDDSPAIDAGNSFGLTTDQRGTGFTRPVDFAGLPNPGGGDGNDIGAYEIQKACPEQVTPGSPCGPQMETTPTSLAFGDVNVGSSSAAQAITVSNTGGTQDLVLGTVTLGGANAGDFATSSDTCSGATLAPDASCTVNVTFTPTSAGAKSATATVTGNAPGNPSDTVDLSGNGVALAPQMQTTPAALAFGDINVGSSSGAQTITVSNSGGTADLVLGTVTLGGSNAGDFSTSSDTCSGATLAPDASCTVGVTFSPTSAGAKAATATVTGNAPSNPSDTVNLSGNGVAPPSTTPPATTPGPTGERARAKMRCKKKFPKGSKKRKRCLKKALRRPV